LAGSAIDFEGGLNGTGFKIVNPNANSTCGCGESFSV
jgi:iron-sulfur cluster assembly protein